jgi:hypothetical protein
LKKDCRSPKKQRDVQQEKNQKSNVTFDVLQDALILSIEIIYETWVVDSGDSFHATPHGKHFLDYVHGDFGQVQGLHFMPHPIGNIFYIMLTICIAIYKIKIKNCILTKNYPL